VYHELKAHLLGRAGKLDEAIAGLDETIEQALVAGHLFWLPELLRRRALLRKQRGDRLADFVEDARAAQVEAQRQGAASLQVRANSTIGFLMGDKEGNEIQFD
jgi:predicted ATPase